MLISSIICVSDIKFYGKRIKEHTINASLHSLYDELPRVNIVRIWHQLYRRAIDIIRKIYNIRRTKSPNLYVSRLIMGLSLPSPRKPGVKNVDLVGAAPTGDAPTTSEWSTI